MRRRCTSAAVHHHLHPHSLPPPLSCFIHNNVMFYVSVVAYAVLVFLFNIAVKRLTIILKSCHMTGAARECTNCHHLLGFSDICGGSNPNPSHESQQSSWEPPGADTQPEGCRQPHLVTGTNLECGLLHLGTSQNIYAVPFLWAQQSSRSDNDVGRLHLCVK